MLHSSCKEGGISEDVEDILGGGDEECFSLFDADAVDVGISPEADDNYERVGMEIDFCSDLHHYSIHREIRAVDEFGVWFGGVIGGTILGPNLIVNSFFGLFDMEFTGFAGCIDTPEVIDAVGDIRGLLDLDEEVTGTNGMESSGRQEVKVTLVRLMGSDDVLHGRMSIDSRSGSELFVLFGCYRAVETGVDFGADIGFEDIPHLGFSHTAMAFERQFVIGMHLDGEVLAGVDELDQEWELVSELLIDAVADEESFVFVDELGEVETKVYITDDAAFHGHGLMPGNRTDLPGLTDIGLGGKDALERGYLVTSPDHGAEVGLEFIGFHITIFLLTRNTCGNYGRDISRILLYHWCGRECHREGQTRTTRRARGQGDAIG